MSIGFVSPNFGRSEPASGLLARCEGKRALRLPGGAEAFAQVILRLALSIGMRQQATQLALVAGPYAPRSKGVQLMLLLCGQLDDVLRVAVPDGLRGVSNPSLQTIPLVPSLSMAPDWPSHFDPRSLWARTSRLVGGWSS
jgi:hypothetical protein